MHIGPRYYTSEAREIITIAFRAQAGDRQPFDNHIRRLYIVVRRIRYLSALLCTPNRPSQTSMIRILEFIIDRATSCTVITDPCCAVVARYNASLRREQHSVTSPLFRIDSQTPCDRVQRTSISFLSTRALQSPRRAPISCARNANGSAFGMFRVPYSIYW